MAEKTLGKVGKRLPFRVDIFLFYSLLVAYMAGGGNLIGDLFSTPIAFDTKIMIFAAIFISLIAIGGTFH